jgi:prepilin-type N-terminal cleavage/methylation domain-containing protein/prepilin-type processing-associated H-X9-DG protein
LSKIELHPNKPRPPRAFTLIELLVVIAVIGILASLLLPALNSAKDRARNADCLSRLKQWAITWRLYADDNDDSFMTGTGVDWARGAWLLPFTNSFPYKPPLLLCPKATDRRGPGDSEVRVPPASPNSVEYGGPTTVYDFPVPDPANTAQPLLGSYGANCWIYNPNINTNEIQGRSADLHWRKYAAAPQPSSTPLFLDSMWRGGGPFETDTPPPFNGFFSWSAFQEMDAFALKRHGKGVNILFFDSSVRNTPARDLWRLPWHVNWNSSLAASVSIPAWMN